MPRQIKNKTRPWNKIHIDRFNWLYNYMEANYENINKMILLILINVF